MKDYLEQTVMVVTVEGETRYGTLKGYDKQGNLILIERGSISIIRGSEVVLCGLVEKIPSDEEIGKIQKLPRCKNKMSIQEETQVWSKRWSTSIK